MKIELKKWNETYFEEIADIFTRCDRSFLSDGLPMPYTPEHAKLWFPAGRLHAKGHMQKRKDI